MIEPHPMEPRGKRSHVPTTCDCGHGREIASQIEHGGVHRRSSTAGAGTAAHSPNTFRASDVRLLGEGIHNAVVASGQAAAATIQPPIERGRRSEGTLQATGPATYRLSVVPLTSQTLCCPWYSGIQPRNGVVFTLHPARNGSARVRPDPVNTHLLHLR